MKPHRCCRSPKIVEGLDQWIQEFVVFGRTVMFCHVGTLLMDDRTQVVRLILKLGRNAEASSFSGQAVSLPAIRWAE